MLEGRWKGGQWCRVTAIEKESEGENRRKKCDLHPLNYFKRRSICSAVGEHKPFLLLFELFHCEWENCSASFCKVWDISDTSPHWPCNAMTGNRRHSMPPREREGESERGSGGRNSWLEWRKCQHFDTNSWGVSKMTNGPTGWALNLTSLSSLAAHLLILDSKSEGGTLQYKPLKVKYHRGDYIIPPVRQALFRFYIFQGPIFLMHNPDSKKDRAIIYKGCVFVRSVEPPKQQYYLVLTKQIAKKGRYQKTGAGCQHF